MAVISTYTYSYVNANTTSYNCETTLYEEDGVVYTVKYEYIGNDLKITLKSDDSKDFYTISRSNEEITIENLEYERTTIFGNDKYHTTTIYDSNESNDCDSINAITTEAYGTKTYTKIETKNGNKYWYCKNSTTSALYYKIGCVASYELNFTKLNSTYQGYLNKYISSITNCNSAYNKALAACGGTVVTSALTVVASLSLIFPPAALLGAVISVLGLGVTTSYYLIDCNSYFSDVEDYYSKIKIKGTKIS